MSYFNESDRKDGKVLDIIIIIVGVGFLSMMMFSCVNECLK